MEEKKKRQKEKKPKIAKVCRVRSALRFLEAAQFGNLFSRFFVLNLIFWLMRDVSTC